MANALSPWSTRKDLCVVAAGHLHRDGRGINVENAKRIVRELCDSRREYGEYVEEISDRSFKTLITEVYKRALNH